jgi:hypothetical protein
MLPVQRPGDRLIAVRVTRCFQTLDSLRYDWYSLL